MLLVTVPTYLVPGTRFYVIQYTWYTFLRDIGIRGSIIPGTGFAFLRVGLIFGVALMRVLFWVPFFSRNAFRNALTVLGTTYLELVWGRSLSR